MITPDLLPSIGTAPDSQLKPLTEAKEEFEKTYLKNVLQLTGGNISRAAQFAGRYRADFYKMLKKYGLHPSTNKGKPGPEIEEIEEEDHLTEGQSGKSRLTTSSAQVTTQCSHPRRCPVSAGTFNPDVVNAQFTGPSHACSARCQQ